MKADADGSAPALSVVIPLHDEEANVPPLLAELVPELEGLGRSWEILAVDDGSRDGTRAALLDARRRHGGRLRILAADRNLGQTAAFFAGFSSARGALVATLDGDLQIDPRDLGPMIALLEREGLDMVHGWRQVRRDDTWKRISTRIANAVRNRLTGESIRDTGCPLKLMRREVLTAFPPLDGMHRFYVTLAHMAGFRTQEMPVRHRPRAHGASKYGVGNRLGPALRDCLAIRRMQRRRIDPRTLARELAASAGPRPAGTRALAAGPESLAREIGHE